MSRFIFISILLCTSPLSLHSAIWDFTLAMDGPTLGTASTGTGGDLHQVDPIDFPVISYDTSSHQLTIPIGWGSANGFVDLEGIVDNSTLPLIRVGSQNGYNLPIIVDNNRSGHSDSPLTLIDNPR